MIVNDDYEYTKKQKLGGKVYKIINNREARQQSLRPEFKEALDLYLKTSVESFPTAEVHSTSWFPLSCWKSFDTNDDIVGFDSNDVIVEWWYLKTESWKNWFQNYVESVYGIRKEVSGVEQ